jgi:hypothetical protein
VSLVEDLTQRLRAFADERDWGQFHTPKNLVMAAGEMGELVAEFQWLTPEQSAAVMEDPEVAAPGCIGTTALADPICHGPRANRQSREHMFRNGALRASFLPSNDPPVMVLLLS